MRNHLVVIVVVMLGTVFACAAGPALADGDVTMTVIPSGGDVVKTVVQNISVPANADKVAKAKAAEPHKATPVAGQDSQSAEQTAQQQLAEAAAEHQAGQTQQLVQQQALQAAQIAAAKARNTAPPAPPPPPWRP